ncbi:hypothetical protein HYU45_02035 [Candidatus Daviesbacteria bacterium]|nr:hypothetical protein [Candidatus Daviesbacteria bacterium]
MDYEEVRTNDGLGIWLRGNDEFRIGIHFWDYSLNRPDPFRYLALETNK